MTEADRGVTQAHRPLETPQAAALAGILFAVLYASSYALILLSGQGEYTDAREWLAQHGRSVNLAVSLQPFAGIAFLWFMGVLRDRLRHQEDQFYSTLFLGSGLLYLAMTFIAAAIGSGLMLVRVMGPEPVLADAATVLARAVMQQVVTVYAVRMAGMFMMVLGTIWYRTGIMPRWLAAITFVGALMLLISIGLSPWIIMVFPAWVFVISVYILVLTYRT